MTTHFPSRSAEIRAPLDPPIIDADAHLNEFCPRFFEGKVVESAAAAVLASDAERSR